MNCQTNKTKELNESQIFQAGQGKDFKRQEEKGQNQCTGDV